MTIKLKEATITAGNEFIHQNYTQGNGIYRVIAAGVIHGLAILYQQPGAPTPSIMFAYENELPAGYLQGENPENPENPENMIREEFALKLVCVALGNDQYKDVK